jgi:hypothetical protein
MISSENPLAEYPIELGDVMEANRMTLDDIVREVRALVLDEIELDQPQDSTP